MTTLRLCSTLYMTNDCNQFSSTKTGWEGGNCIIFHKFVHDLNFFSSRVEHVLMSFFCQFVGFNINSFLKDCWVSAFLVSPSILVWIDGFGNTGYHDDGCWLLSNWVWNCISAGRRKGSSWCRRKYQNQVLLSHKKIFIFHTQSPHIWILEEQVQVQPCLVTNANLCTCHNIKIKWHTQFLISANSFWGRNCIIDKNAKIGRNVVITNADVSAVSNISFRNCNKRFWLSLSWFKRADFSGCWRSRQS